MSLIRVGVLLGFVLGLPASAHSDEPGVPERLPIDITDAWEKAGAEVGWMSPARLGGEGFRSGLTGRPGEMPAFAFRVWKPGTLANLPLPREPWGLDLSLTAVTDAG